MKGSSSTSSTFTFASCFLFQLHVRIVGIRKKEKREKGRLMKLTQWSLSHAPVVLRLAGCW
jgi:hypothetical protein